MFSQSPGGVGLDMTLWYSGDHGVSIDGGTNQLMWLDRSGNTNNAFQDVTGNQADQGELINFNETFTFNGDSDYFAIDKLNYTKLDGDNAQVVLDELSMFVVYNTDFSNTSFTSNWAFLDFDRSATFNFYIHGNGVLSYSYSDGSGTSGVDLNSATTSNDNLPHMGTFLYDSGETNESIIRLDGIEDFSTDLKANGEGIDVFEDRFGFIGDGSEADVVDGDRNDQYYDGAIAEIIFYDSKDLTQDDIIAIETYLAVKYGITLDISNGDYKNTGGDILWSGSSYRNAVAGLVRDDAGALDQRIATSADYDGFIVSTDNDFSSANNDGSRTSIGDGESLMFGHNNVSDGFTVFGNTGVEYLFNKTWYFQERNDDVGDVTIAIEKSIFSGNPLDLIIGSDETFASSRARINMVESGDYYTATVNVSDGEYVSFVMTQTEESPGGLSEGLEIWYKANKGVSETGGKVTNVVDNTYQGNNLSQTVSNNQPSSTGVQNFNEAFTFDGTSDKMPIETKNFVSTDNLTQVYIWTVFNTDFVGSNTSGEYDTDNWAFLDFDRSDWFNTSIHGDGTLQLSYKDGSAIEDVFGVEVNNDGTTRLGGFIFDSSQANETILRVNGNEDIAVDVSTNTITGGGTRFGYVGDGSEATSFDFDSNDGYYEGDISEVIYYENQILDSEQINLIESYLAIKYGITLNNNVATGTDKYQSSGDLSVDSSNPDYPITVWDDATYWNDVIIIGKDEASGLDQKQSKSANTDGVLTVALGTTVQTLNSLNTFDFDDDLDFLAIGNDDGELNDCSFTNIGRNWLVKNTGSVTGVTLAFDLTGLTNIDDFYLVVDNVDFPTAGSVNGNILTYSNIDLADGEVFTLKKDAITYNGAWSGGNNGGVWDDSPTDLTKSVHITSSVTLAEAANCKCLKVESGSVLTVEDGDDILVSDIIELDGDIYLYGDAELVQTLDENMNTGTGDLRVGLTVGAVASFNNSLWGVPVNEVSTYNINDNLLETSDVNDYSSATTLASNPLYFTKNNQASVSGADIIDKDTDLAIGNGFVMLHNGAAIAVNYVFSGTPNNGLIESELDAGNFSYLGNPYPSVLNIDDFNTYNLANNNTTGVAYFLADAIGSNPGTDYVTGFSTRAEGIGVGAVTIGGNPSIEPTSSAAIGKGFVVEGVTDDNNATFNNSLRNDTSSSSALDVIRIGFEYETAADGTFHRQLAASLNAASTMGVDVGSDAFMLDDFSTDMYWDLDAKRYVINSVPLFVGDNIIMPLGIELEEAENIVIKLDDIGTYANKVYVWDEMAGTLTDLTLGDFSLSNLASGTYEDRFNIILGTDESTLSVEQDLLESKFYTYFNTGSNDLVIVSGDLEVESISLYSLVGTKLVSINPSEGESTNVIPLEEMVSGVYIMQLKTALGTVSKKVIVNKN